jgi:hypothetical protein
MLQITFKTFDDRASDQIAAEAFVLDHSKLETSPEGRLIALQVNHEWQVSNRSFVRFECAQAVMCLFERDGKVAEAYGAYGSVTCVDGVLWAQSHAIAHLKNQSWISLATSAAWPHLRLAPAREVGK